MPSHISMGPDMAPVIFFLFFVLIVTLIILGFLAAAKRRKELAAWAAAHGLTFDQGHDRSVDNRYPAFHCLRHGDNRYAYNCMSGRWENFDLFAFDYHYETESTDSKGNSQKQTHTFSAVILRTALPLKPLFIRPEGLFDKVSSFFGFDDIDFESSEFSRKFYVKSPDKKWAYDVLHARTMQFLLDSPRYHIQFEGHDTIAWTNSKFKLTQFESAIKVVSGILDALPEYLVKELEGIG